jgi:hypothetical protein
LVGNAIFYTSKEGTLFEALNSVSIMTILTKAMDLLEAISGLSPAFIVAARGCIHLGLFMAILELQKGNYRRLIKWAVTFCNLILYEL